MSDEIKTLLEELKIDVSDDTIGKLNSIIDAAVSEKLEEANTGDSETRELLVEARDEIVNLRSENLQLKDRVNEFDTTLEESVATFLKENEDRFVGADEHTRMKSAFERIHSAFEENGFVLNENAELEALKVSTSKLIDRHDETLKENVELNSELMELKRVNVINESVNGLTDIDSEKVRTIADSISFDSLEELKEGIALIVDRIKTPGEKTELESLKESEEVVTEVKDPALVEKMNRYLSQLDRLSASSK